jgi:spermidine dehydrogenase
VDRHIQHKDFAMKMTRTELGMDRPITRRDFMQGTAIAIGAAGAVGWNDAALAATTDEAYPPAKTGMRGTHPGSFEPAHEMRDGTLSIGSANDVDKTYDLIVVGGGLSGLASAHFFRDAVGPDARILVLDNHDDFGGHAKRNEFTVNGKSLVVNGGTVYLENPGRYDKWSRKLLDDIGIDIARFEKANKAAPNPYQGLNGSYFFDKETWGKDALVGRGRAGSADFISRTPLSAKAQQDYLRIYSPQQPDYLPNLDEEAKKLLLAKTSYQDYLLNIAKVDKSVLWFVQNAGAGNFCVGADALPALFAANMEQPGFAGLKLSPMDQYVFADLPGGSHGRQLEDHHAVHFPDGNATLARLLVRKLIPDAVDGVTQEDLGTARVYYDRLDRDSSNTRIRLNSIAVRVVHDGDPSSAKEATVTYIRGGRMERVRAKAIILACWNMAIPYMAPELPQAQKDAMAYGVKGPLLYTRVAVKNWHAFKKMGISNVASPSMYHDSMSLAPAVSVGNLKHAQSPDEPVVVELTRVLNAPGLPRREQHRMGRNELLATTFEQFELKIREHMTRVLGPGGFDPARDIAAITVNRWPHGYAYTYNSLYDPLEWVFTESPNRPCVIARQPFGVISIANSDAAASPHTDAAFLEGHRAVGEVIARRSFPFMHAPADVARS